MSIVSNPRISIALLAAQLAQTIKGRRDLICGQLIGSAGSAVAGTLYTDVAKKTKSELDSLFGVNSNIRNCIDQFISSNGGYSTVDVKVIAAPVGEANKCEIDFASGVTATEDGEYTFKIADDRQFSKTISVKTGDTIADFLGNVYNAYFTDAGAPANFPFSPGGGGVAGTAITFSTTDTAKIGSDFQIEIEGNVAGIGEAAVTLTASTASDPDVSDFFDNLQSSRFTGVVWPWGWNSQASVLTDYLDDRFNASNAILDGVGFMGYSDTFANVKAFVDSKNSQSLCVGGYSKSVIHPADWAMSNFAGIRARRLTVDAPIANYITTTSGVLDAFGGPALASLPYFNSPMNQMSVVDPNVLYSSIEQSELEEAGFSVLGVNSAENQMITGPMVTTYTTDIAGNPNDSFHYLNYVDTSSICREYFFNNLKARFSQSRLTNGSLVPGRSIENEESVRAEFSKIYKELSLLSLTVAGAEAEKFFKQYLNVTLDLASRKVTATFQLPIVTQLGNMIVTAQLNFNFQEA